MPDSGFLEPLRQVVVSTEFLFGSTFGAALGWLIKYWLGERSAIAANKRKFFDRVTEQISQLAGDYYWSLGNHSGVVAGALEDYIQTRDSYLLFQWRDYAQLKEALDTAASEVCDNSFPYLCRLIALFDDFQFGKGNTYLLPDYWSGEISKKLYNRFSDATDRVKKRQIVEVLAKMGVERESPEEAARLINRAIAEEELEDVRKSYLEWLKRGGDEVRAACDALRAYSELLNHELGVLYKEWFARKRFSLRPALETEVEYCDLPHDISEAARRAIDRARFQKTLMSAIGPSATPEEKAVSPERGRLGDEPEKAERSKSRKEEPEEHEEKLGRKIDLSQEVYTMGGLIASVIAKHAEKLGEEIRKEAKAELDCAIDPNASIEELHKRFAKREALLEKLGKEADVDDKRRPTG